MISSVHPLADREEVSFSELRYENFIASPVLPPLPGISPLLTTPQPAGFLPNIVGEAETVSSLLMMVACGVGITVLYKEHQPIFRHRRGAVYPTEGRKIL